MYYIIFHKHSCKFIFPRVTYHGVDGSDGGVPKLLDMEGKVGMEGVGEVEDRVKKMEWVRVVVEG